MEARAAAIAAGEADECIWLVEHPPLYTAGTSARAEDLTDPDRFPVYPTRRGGQYTYHGPGQRVAYVMLDVGARGRDVRCFVRELEELGDRHIGQFNLRGEIRAGACRRLGAAARKTGPGRWQPRRRQDRRDRNPAAQMGQLSRHQHQCRAGPQPFWRHRPLRHHRTTG